MGYRRPRKASVLVLSGAALCVAACWAGSFAVSLFFGTHLNELPQELDFPSSAKAQSRCVGDVVAEISSSHNKSLFNDYGVPDLRGSFSSVHENSLSKGVGSSSAIAESLKLGIDPDLQASAISVMQRYNLPWAAIVAVEPRTGRVLTLASHSSQEPSAEVALKASFPAASLFKLVTAVSGVERAGLAGGDKLAYRGHEHRLTQGSYFPNARLDNKTMGLDLALAKSVNPIFARIALGHLAPKDLESYAVSFGFESGIPFELPIEPSSFSMQGGDYEFARTAAGFGEVFISPLHAALIGAAIANDGLMMRPYLVDEMTLGEGEGVYRVEPSVLRRVALSSASREVGHMMRETVTSGTAKGQFQRLLKGELADLAVAGKTGTLNGQNPEGLYNWFVGFAPAEDPQVAFAALVIDPGNAQIRGVALARLFFEAYTQKYGSDG